MFKTGIHALAAARGLQEFAIVTAKLFDGGREWNTGDFGSKVKLSGIFRQHMGCPFTMPNFIRVKDEPGVVVSHKAVMFPSAMESFGRPCSWQPVKWRKGVSKKDRKAFTAFIVRLPLPFHDPS